LQGKTQLQEFKEIISEKCLFFTISKSIRSKLYDSKSSNPEKMKVSFHSLSVSLRSYNSGRERHLIDITPGTEAFDLQVLKPKILSLIPVSAHLMISLY
jgi:hypothetical protein